MNDRDTLASALDGRYEIEREIGRGGMATVYLARDVRHDRPVALKLLSPELGAVLGAERFLSEIKVTANLQHPNLLPLFDSGEANGLLFYVMPYVEGETLRHRLDREKQLPVDEAVRIAAGIAGALDYAHRHGVIHRDLKPENVLLHDGQPLVADFGIALAVSNAGGARVTQTGLSLGTPQYMSPEQATGDRAIDQRTDIYSLGALTYEMLAGEPPHTGGPAQAIIARLMTEDPRPLTVIRRNVPPYVDAAVRCALEKLPADRFATAKEFGDALQGRGAVPTGAVAMDSVSRRRPVAARALAITAAVSSMVAIAALVAWWRASHGPLPDPVRFTVAPPAGLRLYDGAPGLSVALSRDGKTLAFLAGEGQLYVRRLGELDATPLPKAGRPADLHFSPDGKWIGYMSGGFNKIAVDEASPTPTRVVSLSIWNGMTWGYSDDMIYAIDKALWRATADGKPKKIAAADTTTAGGWSQPSVLPDGKTIAIRVTPTGATFGLPTDRLAFVSLDDGAVTNTDVEGQHVIGYVDGILVFARTGGRIMAARFDLARRKAIGDPVMMLDSVSFKTTGGAMAALSDNGTLAYLVGSADRVMEVHDERGALTATLGEPRRYGFPVWSPDGRRIALQVTGADAADIWTYDVVTRVLSRITQAGGAIPVWTHDGKRILFSRRDSSSRTRAWSVESDGSRGPSPLAGTDSIVAAGIAQIATTPDGRYALLRVVKSGTSRLLAIDGYAVPLGGGPLVPIELGGPGASIAYALAVSPNGRWIAYSSGVTGRQEIYVQSFPSGAGKVQLSADGGTEPRWSPDGHRLFYRGKGAFRAAVLDIGGTMPRVMRTDSLFADTFIKSTSLPYYDVHPDGKHFLVMRDAGEGAKIIVVTNWIAEARAKLGMK